VTEFGWRKAVTDYIAVEALPHDKLGHMARLYALAVRIGRMESLEWDDEILFAATWMHDLGVFLGHRPKEKAELERWNHVPYTVARTRELLAGWGFPEEKLHAVAEAIETHQPADNPVTTEAILLRDADILEQLGAIGALRALVKTGRDSRYPSFSSVMPVLQGALKQLPARLRLNSSRLLAAPRVDVLSTLIAAIESEAGGLLM